MPMLQEGRVTEMEADFEQNQADLKLAFKRISDLQAALEEGIESDFSDRWGLTLTTGYNKASQVVVLNENSVIVTQRKLM